MIKQKLPSVVHARAMLFFRVLLFILLSQFSINSFSAQPTPQQIDQFKRLSTAEQNQLAQQLGISLPSQSTSLTNENITLTQSVMPRSLSLNNEQQQGSDQLASVLASVNAEQSNASDRLPFFGYDLFAGNPTTFEPVTDVPVSSDYLLGPGDSLKVNLYGKQSQFFELSIDQEGSSYIPELGPISLAGLTFSEAKEKIVKTIDQKMIGVRASVSMGQLRSIRVFVLGEAFLPGSYVVSALSTITNALVLSGGVSELGSLRTIQLKRQGKLIETLDLYDLLLKGDTRNDAQLKSGDVVFIPPVSSRVGIKGEVRRPAYYELKAGEVLHDVLGFAGGVLPSAYTKAASVNRIQDKGDRILVDIDLSDPSSIKAELQDGDILDVPKILEKVKKVVTLSGHVARPQRFTWFEGLRISHLVPSTDFLKDKSDLDYALIKRYQYPAGTLEVLSFSLAKSLSFPGTSSDPILKDQDEVIFFSSVEPDALNGGAASNKEAAIGRQGHALNNTLIADNPGETGSLGRMHQINQIVAELRAQARINEPSREVSISGDVRFPGIYPLVESMTVIDLITAAGGLTEQAFQLYAELNRAEFDRAQTLVQSRFNLDLSAEASLKTQLKSRDVLQIKTIPNWAESNTVTLSGEVRFPGTYSINKGDTLATVIERAGGLTEFAYAPGAMFTRVALKEQQTEQLAEMQERLEADIAKAEVVAANQSSASVKPKDIGEAQKILSQLKTTKATGRLVIDLEKVINERDSYVIALEDGDELVIPRKKNSVTIVGEVQLPISQVYESDLSYWDYIQRSGGLTNKADEEKIYIIKANGGVLIPKTSNWFASNNETLAPGDTIVVPLDAEKVDQVILWRDMSQIFSQIAFGAAAIGSL